MCNEELHGKGSYMSNGSVQGFGFDSISEDDIGECDEEALVQKNSERHEKGNKQANGCHTKID